MKITETSLPGVLAGQFSAASCWAVLYHMTRAGAVSWCGFACAIFARAYALLHGIVPGVTPIPSAGYSTLANRPRNSQLSNNMLKTRFDVQSAHWETALDNVILRLTDSLGSIDSV